MITKNKTDIFLSDIKQNTEMIENVIDELTDISDKIVSISLRMPENKLIKDAIRNINNALFILKKANKKE